MTLKERLNKGKVLAYNPAGAQWQETMIVKVEKFSEAHKAIGRLVTNIHEGLISPNDATSILSNLPGFRKN